MKTFATYGDLGDILYLCPCMKLVAEESGEPVTLYARNGLRLHDPITERIPLFRRLLETQDYIDAVLPWDGEEVDYDACLFRNLGLPFGETLAGLQAKWLGLTPDFSRPWLKVTPDYWGTITVNRTLRYPNVFFPWAGLVEAFGPHMLFLGLPEEYADFIRSFGKISYLPTLNLFKAAEVIAASELFIGNQSCCFAIAEGLKHRSIQATDLEHPDCIFPRENAIHCHDGALDFTFNGRHFTSRSGFLLRAHPNETPAGGWSVTVGKFHANAYAFELVIQEIKSKLQAHGEEVPGGLRDLIIEQNSQGFQDHPVTRLLANSLAH
jgi:hypothetical protein